EGADHRGGDAAGHDDGRHQEARPSGTARGTRFAGRANHAGHGCWWRPGRPARWWWRGTGDAGRTDVLRRGEAFDVAGGAETARRNPARAGLPAGRVRDDEAALFGNVAIVAHRPGD